MNNPNRKQIKISILIPFLVLAVVFAIFVSKKYNDTRDITPKTESVQPEKPLKRKVVLLFVAEDGTSLEKEGREIDSCETDESCISDVVEELAAGSLSGLKSPIPDNLVVNSVAISADRAIVDIDSTFADALLSGSMSEMLALYSIVDTVVLNNSKIKSVKLTSGGSEIEHLKHLDLREALEADFSMVKEEK